MAKKELAQIKLQLPAGKANPSPPVGPALSQHGVNIMEFCKAFNAQTQAQEGMVIPVVITVYQDRSFSYIMKTPPAAILLKKAAGIVKGDGYRRSGDRRFGDEKAGRGNRHAEDARPECQRPRGSRQDH